MKSTRNVLAILALASFAFAFAQEPGTSAKHPETTASESKGTAESKATNESKEMQNCGQCKDCTKGGKKMIPPKVRDTGPDMPDYMS